jgi:hypothetical protein
VWVRALIGWAFENAEWEHATALSGWEVASVRQASTKNSVANASTKNSVSANDAQRAADDRPARAIGASHALNCAIP